MQALRPSTLSERCQTLSPLLMNLGGTGSMSTQARAPYLLGRVAVRAGVGVWRHRGGVLMAAIVTVVLGGYVAIAGTPQIPTSLAAASPSATRSASAAGDCADTAMAA